MHARDGNGVQDAEAIGEGSNRKFSRQRRQEIHCSHLDEGIKAPLDDLGSRSCNELPADHVQEEYRVAGVDIWIRAVAKPDKADDLTVQAGFLLHFTDNRGFGRFIVLDKPARQGPIAAVWFLIALDEENCTLAGGIGFHDDPPDAERMPPKIYKTTAACFTRAVWSLAPLHEVYAQLPTALRTKGHA
jgi:hypothetical protein